MEHLKKKNIENYLSQHFIKKEDLITEFATLKAALIWSFGHFSAYDGNLYSEGLLDCTVAEGKKMIADFDIWFQANY